MGAFYISSNLCPKEQMYLDIPTSPVILRNWDSAFTYLYQYMHIPKNIYGL